MKENNFIVTTSTKFWKMIFLAQIIRRVIARSRQG